MHSPATAQGTVRPKMPKKLHSSTQFKENIGSPFCTIKSAPKTNAAKQISIPTYQKENSERLPKAVFRNKPSSVDKRQYEVTSTDVNIVDLPYNLNSYFLKAGITAYIGRSLYGKNNIYRHGCT